MYVPLPFFSLALRTHCIQPYFFSFVICDLCLGVVCRSSNIPMEKMLLYRVSLLLVRQLVRLCMVPTVLAPTLFLISLSSAVLVLIPLPTLTSLVMICHLCQRYHCMFDRAQCTLICLSLCLFEFHIRI